MPTLYQDRCDRPSIIPLERRSTTFANPGEADPWIMAFLQVVPSHIFAVRGVEEPAAGNTRMPSNSCVRGDETGILLCRGQELR